MISDFQMDKSGVDLSLLDELFMFNSILSEPSNITEGPEKGELIEKMVDKITLVVALVMLVLKPCLYSRYTAPAA